MCLRIRMSPANRIRKHLCAIPYKLITQFAQAS